MIGPVLQSFLDMRSLSLTEIGSLAHSLKIRHLPDETPWLMNILMLPQVPCSSWPKYLSEMNSLAKGKKLAISLLVFICYFNLSGHILTYVKQQVGAEKKLWFVTFAHFLLLWYKYTHNANFTLPVWQYRIWKRRAQWALCNQYRLVSVHHET